MVRGTEESTAPTKKRGLLIRWGTKAGNWLRNSAPKFADRVEVAGLIDIDGVTLAPQDAPGRSV